MNANRKDHDKWSEQALQLAIWAVENGQSIGLVCR